MSTILTEGQEVEVPAWVIDLPSFRRWSDQEDFPDTGRIWYIRGKVWLDMSKEQLYTHGSVKSEFAFALVGLVKAGRLGRYWCDSAYITSHAILSRTCATRSIPFASAASCAVPASNSANGYL